MVNREACERRVYRLAALLTGDTGAAVGVIAEVIGAQPDLRRLDTAHLDRLAVLRSRAVPAGPVADADMPPAWAGAIAGLPPQGREAWVFARVYGLSSRQAARAMDCSVTATGRHLEQADAALAGAGVPPGEAAAALRAWSMRLDVPAFYRAAQRRRRRVRWLWRTLAAVVALAAIIALLRRLAS
ncbi:MAG: sigma factor-like helix-turn-helix DNA-binding protein [Planctomycetota bacterium]